MRELLTRTLKEAKYGHQEVRGILLALGPQVADQYQAGDDQEDDLLEALRLHPEAGGLRYLLEYLRDPSLEIKKDLLHHYSQGQPPSPEDEEISLARVPPKSIGSGTQVRLPDGRIVTIKEEATPYLSLKEEAAAYGEQTVEVVDADGNVQRIPISQIQGVIDESGQEVQLSDQDRKELRVFQKGQQVETNSGVTGKVTKVRGWGDKMVLTVQGPEGAVTVKPADVKNIVTEQEQSPGEGPPPEGTKPETKPPANAPQETKLQVPYVPTSKGRSMNTVAPRYMAEAVSNYLKNLQERDRRPGRVRAGPPGIRKQG